MSDPALKVYELENDQKYLNQKMDKLESVAYEIKEKFDKSGIVVQPFVRESSK
jgi:hypothetical protein